MHTISTFLQILIGLKLIFFRTNNCAMIIRFSYVAGSDMNSITYLTIAHKQNCALQKLNVNKD